MKMCKRSVLGASVLLILAGCNSGGGSSDSNATTPVTLSVSDAPLDGVSEVVVTYNKVAFLPLDGSSPLLFDVYKTDEDGNYVDENGAPLPDGDDPLPLSVNLLDFQGSDSKSLLDDQDIPTGNYKLCLFAHDGDHPTYPSYVKETGNGNQVPLTVKGNGKCPQGVGEFENTGTLYFNDTFTVNDQNNDYVAEFDLRRGLKEDSGEYTIQRTSVMLINTVTTGEIEGVVSLATYNGCETDTTSGNSFAHAVYLYEGNVAKADMGTFAGTGNTAPVAAANVVTEDNGLTYEYEFGFVAPGTYSVGYTCTANDDSEEGIVAGENFSIYTSQSSLTVAAGSEVDANL
ncbi:DUF4382 domain-containing protein [Vibrio sinaloensis]|uniref:DUF4382 domain-containing protein n=1 Tax=Photobacterium sp. (strain ATCC 43367) TaxID=379097 RepID=UPI00057DA425|nr:DUF4382 domain-containing protein [Vibrio sinaloensis]KHT51911.1 hypothetical protein RJ46_04110 [Vibrio sinaloensis]